MQPKYDSRLISVAIVVTTKNVSSAKVVKKPKKTALKKGW